MSLCLLIILWNDKFLFKFINKLYISILWNLNKVIF